MTTTFQTNTPTFRPGSLTSKIFAVAKNRPVKGVTSDEVYTRLARQGLATDFQTLTGRISELKTRGILVDTGTTRTLTTGKPGQVLVVNQNYL